ncbi:MAG: von Willebrand factor type A domain-containing protein, partial [Bacteroidota bacterium]
MKQFLLLSMLVCFVFSLPAQDTSERWVEGYVRDANGDGIPGVNIIVKSTTNGTVTDANGFFRIKMPIGGVLVFNAVGLVSQEVTVGSQPVLRVDMVDAVKELDEVVVTGYAESSQNALSGSVAGLRVRKKRKGKKNKTQTPPPATDYLNESYDPIAEGGFQNPSSRPLSTFSVDVDRAAYSNLRRFINQGQRPPKDAVRIEEMINYFDYDYPQPQDAHPFSIYTELSQAPWNQDHQLLHIGLQGRALPREELPPTNLVFLIDVSGSMSAQNKLPLLQSSLKLLVKELRPEDRVAIVVYAGAAGEALSSTPARQKDKIIAAIEQLRAGGSTAGGQGLKLAYKIARQHFKKNGNNRVILATDGDFNVGPSSDREMVRLIEEERKSGIYLTCLGFGMGNLKDSKMEKLADKGNGNYAYIDNILEANKTLVSEFGGTLYTIAQDVKLQLEFNPQYVQAYRLIGYENRILEDEDFNDDEKDAGEIGSGHTVTALYEIISVGVKSKIARKVDALKYQRSLVSNSNAYSSELLTVKFRYKRPGEKESRLLEEVVSKESITLEQSSDNFRFSAAVAAFGMLLRDSEYIKGMDYQEVIDLAKK